MLDRYFLDHPRSVGESYFEHMRAAASFGGAMLAGACACFVHAFIPGLFKRTGSSIIARLYDGMVRNRRRREAHVESAVHAAAE